MRALLALFLATSSLGCLADGTEVEEGDAADREAEAVRGGYVGKFNRAAQGHADECVRIKGDAIALRYADGSPTGFVITRRC